VSFALLLAFTVHATAYDDTFAKALQAYTSGDYATSVLLYEQLVDEGVEDSALFYDLGNAYAKQELYGRAIANFERALQLQPDMPHARQNKAICLERSGAKYFAPPPRKWEQALLFWHFEMSRRASINSAVATWLIVWALLAFRLWKPVRGISAAIALAVVACIFAGLSVFAKSTTPKLAVATAPKVTVRFAPNDEEKARLELSQGDTVVVEELQSDWVRISTDMNDRGWVQRNQICLVGPPYAQAITAPMEPRKNRG
jgi:tetratricopeptide (TPR) repeat protein